ncbi:hypothetical protein BASA50_010871 [Batrachochytrium salamandrivorans]|uniref:Transmembrane protein n=1 Tax=Batrachochytrium salamandrivorans TaxID=1357716 RepID=A0ABQ8F0F3_9FUNG|nr:hypothetical protein BASA50_010871 [Batrachochytrium salamandrivorans]
MSPLLIPASTPVATTTTVATTVATTTVATTTVATTTVATIITTMSIVFVIFLIVVILLAIRAFNYVSIWWYREADHSEQDTFFEVNSYNESLWRTSGLGVCQPYSQPLPMPSSSFFVRGIDERICDLPMRSEMQAHSHRAMPTVISPICNDLNTAKIQTIRSGFGQNHHLVSRLARELPQMGGGRQVPGSNPFLASTYQSNLSPQYATIGRTVVHLPPPAVYLLPRPVPPSLAPEILAPIVVEPIQSLSVAVSHTPDRNPAKISGILKRKRTEHEMMSAARPIKIRRIQEMPDLGCATEGRSHRESTTKVQEIRKLAKIRRSRRVRFGGVPATPRRGAAMRTPLKTYTRGNQIRPDLLLTPRGRPSIGRLISFWDAPMVAMGISPPPEVYGDALSYITLTPCQAQNEPCQAMDISPPKFETDPIKPKTVSGLVSFWNAMSNDMSMDVAPIPTEYEKQHVPVMEWGLADFKEPISPMDMSSPDQSNGWESPIGPSSDLPRQSVSVEKLDCLWADPEEGIDDLSCPPDDELEHLSEDHDDELENLWGCQDDELEHLWGCQDDELEHLWGCSNGSVGDYGKSTPEIPAVSSDNFFRIRTPESPESKNMDMDTSGFLGKENMTPSPTFKSSVFKGYGFSPKNPVSSRDIAIGGVKRAVTTPDMPRQSVSPVEMDCSWADSVDRRSRITPPNPFFISEPSTWRRPQTPPQPNHGVSPMLSTAPPSHSFPAIPIPGPYSLPLPSLFSYNGGTARTSHGANGFSKKRMGRL